jgi:corrinoid protein of di/trimethylamine methyltransferase
MNEKTLDIIKNFLINYDSDGIIKEVKNALNEDVDPLDISYAITDALKIIGDGFNKGELFLPDLMLAAETAKNVMPIIEEELLKGGKKKKSLGLVVIGTVLGDVHDIGKTMVSTLLSAAGFEVFDLGVDVSAERFIAAVKEHKPDILAMSALMTMTAAEQPKIIEGLKKEGLRDKVKIMIGGGPISQEFADSIGADGFRSHAPGAVELAMVFMGINELRKGGVS